MLIKQIILYFPPCEHVSIKLIFLGNIVDYDFKGREFFLYNVTKIKHKIIEVSLLGTSSTSGTDGKIQVQVIMILNDRNYS